MGLTMAVIAVWVACGYHGLGRGYKTIRDRQEEAGGSNEGTDLKV